MAGARQLAAILITEIDGYAALMEQDPAAAADFKKRHRDILQQQLPTFHGKIIQATGHESLCVFHSAVETVRCALAMQEAFADEPGVPVKMGVHMGDIIFTGEEAIGDSIEVARGIVSRSVPGGILISNKIQEEVKTHGGIETRFFKSCELKEQGMEVKVYAVVNAGIQIPLDLIDSRTGMGVDREQGSGLRYYWEEAKRRKVVKVVSIYAAAAYVVLETSSIISDSLNFPDWIMVMIIGLLVILFIVLAIVSWIYDITPEGIKKTVPVHEMEEVVDEPPPLANGNWFVRNRILRRYLVPAVVLVLLVGFYFFKDRIFANWERVNRVALEHTERAKLYLDNFADPQLVKEELDLALEADPDYSQALYYYALLHLREGDTAGYKQKLHDAVRFDPGHSRAWNALATYAFLQDSFDQAMRYTFNALEADPGYSFAAYNMAIQMEDRDLLLQADELFKKAIEMDSCFAEAYSAQGALYNKMGRPVDAIFTLKESLRISPAHQDNYRIYKNLAEAYFLLNDYDMAWTCLLESKTLAPDYPETEKCFARYYEATGDPQASILHWRRYLALETDSLEVRKAEIHLDSVRLSTPE